MKNKLSDSQLAVLLKAYTAPVQVTELAIDTMVRQARVRAVTMRAELEAQGLYALLKRLFGLSRLAPVAWSGAVSLALALVIGLGAGFSGVVPGLDDASYALDFDNVLGTNTMAASTDLTL